MALTGRSSDASLVYEYVLPVAVVVHDGLGTQ